VIEYVIECMLVGRCSRRAGAVEGHVEWLSKFNSHLTFDIHPIHAHITGIEFIEVCIRFVSGHNENDVLI